MAVAEGVGEVTAVEGEVTVVEGVVEEVVGEEEEEDSAAVVEVVVGLKDHFKEGGEDLLINGGGFKEKLLRTFMNMSVPESV